jgi:nitric oxide reductase
MILLCTTTLLQHPAQLEKLKTEPALAPAFIPELCRYHTGSVIATRRVANADIKLEGHQIKAGEGMMQPPSLRAATKT